MEEPTRIYYPPRPLKAGERFDMIVGKFLRRGEHAAGTVAYRAATDLRDTCDTCARPLRKGEEIAEDFVRGHLTCMSAITPAQARRIMRRWWEHEGPKMSEAAAADAMFDAGEWSSAFHYTLREQREDEVLARLGQDLNTFYTVDHELDHREMEFVMRAHGA